MTYILVQYYISFSLTLRQKYSLVATATTAFFSLIKQKILQNILDYYINQFGLIIFSIDL